ncbi:hypothetical protein ACUY28_03345 [Corynebacterium sanguinis]|uniref:Tellurium resistance protein TerC n=2 Tax=Corynebacterium sanguinis TaxID=2594913 RepID=A0A838X250_9CORY|nr:MULTISPECIES: hypothetical protein [Corynebacterium]MBA4505171.1 hypothetical protein [Corynebacterium sanguinis]MCT1413362.1 hypothetical protein [Corynebacterium sanguinis]MCT1463313.1 hypothetical protein [Corynebacterium sanguinis]MCT1555065.1 hypothetical protein [Corynebacterium sanguinis]MCT1663571.1 hypothetical protein [Corynebacterium sanguinis]
MFPTMVGGTNDPNRRPARPYTGEEWPPALRTSYWLIIAAAVLMLVTGMVLLTAGFPEAGDEQFREAFMRNTRVTALGNIVLALCMVVAAAQFPKGLKGARGWACGFIAVAIFINLAAFVIQVTSWASFAIVVALTFAVFFMFRPAANQFVERP